MRNKVLEVAKSYIGTQQVDGRHRELIQKYNAVKPLPVGYPMKVSDDWCAAFVTVVGDITDTSKYFGRECGVQRFVQIFKEKDIWHELGKPIPGDIVVFDWQKNGWTDHIGFVEKFNGHNITTLEGNTSRQVARRTYAWNDWRVAGYARPKYPVNSADNHLPVEKLAKEVIQGAWGNGEERISRLSKAGHDVGAVQEEVNRLLKKNSREAQEAIAKEVVQGKWENGKEREKLLTEAGYDYEKVQEIVNRII